ncbi:unnamed protein product [Brassica napus]|uniref:(rape) hypothetical protein n=1 Tax=Brassica napus TaxID=3708 RepID=A0A816IF97_BRANA|nr:unnamed protein product [Brassica napus]
MHVGGGVGGGGGQRLRTVVRHLIPEEGGDNAAAAATLSPEDSYSPNKSVRVAELDLALDLSIGRNHSKCTNLDPIVSVSGSMSRSRDVNMGYPARLDLPV